MNFSYCFSKVGADLTNDEVKNSTAPNLWLYDNGTGTWTKEKCFTGGKFNRCLSYTPGRAKT